MITIQNFIFCWNNFVSSSVELEKNLKTFGDTLVINSNQYNSFDRWITLNDGYFSEQWNCLLNNINENVDYIFHIQSDASIKNYHNIFNRFKQMSLKHDIGVYSPNINNTWHSYHINKLNKIDDFVYEVPNTDCTCWFINTKLIDKNVPLYDLNKNKYGYGADWYYSAKSRLNKKMVVRDYSITIEHPNFKGYDGNKANEEFLIWKSEQSFDIKNEINIIEQEVYEKNTNYKNA